MKTVDEIYQEMAQVYETFSGMEVSYGGELYIRMYAVAAQIYAQQVQAQWTLQQCFPQTATGEYLDNFALMRGLSRRQSAKAQGEITFTLASELEEDVTIETGAICLNYGSVRFETLQQGVIKAGELSVTVAAEAAESGAEGNAAATSICRMAVWPEGVVKCSNAAEFTGGSDEEDDSSLRARVLATFASLPNGGNAAYYKSAAMSVTGVSQAVVLPKARGAGTVDVVISSSSGLPDEQLLQTVQQEIQAQREIAVDVQVCAPKAIAVAVDVDITPAKGVSFETAKEHLLEKLESFFGGSLLGKGVSLAQLGALIYDPECVENYRINSPAGDITAGEIQLPVAESVQIGEMSL